MFSAQCQLASLGAITEKEWTFPDKNATLAIAKKESNATNTIRIVARFLAATGALALASIPASTETSRASARRATAPVSSKSTAWLNTAAMSLKKNASIMVADGVQTTMAILRA